MFGEAHGARFAKSAHGPGPRQQVRGPGPSVPVAHVRHGPGRGPRGQHVVRVADDRRVCVPGHARAGSGRRHRAQGPDRGLYWTETATLEVRRPSE